MSLITYLTTTRFGDGEIRNLGEDLAAAGITRALVVTDAGLVATGLVERVLANVDPARIVGRFEKTPSNPTEAAASEAVALYKEAGADGCLAIGGGSPIDLAKAVALLGTHEGPLAHYAAILGGLPRIVSPAPVVAVPTTSGTGAEVGRAALLTLNDGRKLGFISPKLIPARAICDPELTLGLPPRLTAATGIDAISHCIETYLSPRDNPPAEAIALDGLARAAKAIVRVTEDGSDIAARREMMMAALEGGLTFQKGLGAIHAVSHPLGGLGDLSLHHGELNGVMLPHVLAFNAPVARDKYARLREVLGLRPSASLAEWASNLVSRLRLPTSLSAMGVTPDHLRKVLPGVLADHSVPTNPRPLNRAEAIALLKAAWR